eukprot:IDg1988t1
MGRIPITDMSDIVVGFVYSIQDIEQRMTTSAMSGEQVRKEIANFYPPASLFSTEIKASPIVYTHPREFINAHNSHLTSYLCWRIVMTLTLKFYEDSEDTAVLEEIAKAIVIEGRSATRTGTGAV